MSEITIPKILENIQYEIEKRNRLKNINSVPDTTEFYRYIADSSNLKISTVPELMDLLVKSHKIFLFDIIEEDSEKNITCVEGVVLTDLSLIKSVLVYYEKELVRLYSEEFDGHHTIMQVMNNFSRAMRKKYNNTPVGKAANTVIDLHKFEDILKRDFAYNRNARTYSDEWKEKKYNKLINDCGPVENFLKGPDDDAANNENKTDAAQPRNKRRKVDQIRNVEKIKITLQNSIESNLAVYGVEFYARICFREYKFSVVKKILVENHIKKKEDFQLLKKVIQRVRTHSDRDMNLQKYASEINELEKIINNKINNFS